MAQYFTNFSGYSDTSGVESDFDFIAPGGNTAQYSLNLASDSSYQGGKLLEVSNETSSAIAAFWNTPGNVGEVEIFIKYQNVPSVPYYTRSFTSSSDFSEGVIFTNEDDIETGKIITVGYNGDGGTVNTVSYDWNQNNVSTLFSIAPSSDTAKAKQWLNTNSEPSSWDIENTSLGVPSSYTNEVAFILPEEDVNGNKTTQIDSIGVGTNGDTAPKETPSSSASGSNQTSFSADLDLTTLNMGASGLSDTQNNVYITRPVDAISSGSNETFTFAKITDVFRLTASGISSTSSSSKITDVYRLTASGIDSTQSFADIFKGQPLVGEGINDTSTTGSITFAVFLTGNGENTAEGTGLSVRLIELDANSIGEGTGDSIISSGEFLDASGLSDSQGSSNAEITTYNQNQLDSLSENFIIGNTEIPLLVSKDVSVDRETIVKDFVEQDSEIFEDNQSFESGTYSAFLNPKNHSQNKSIEEQMDDVEQLLEASAQANEIEYTDGTAYLAVQGISDVIDVNPNLREVELDVIVLEDI